jgi:hypothetical protein
MAGESNSGGLAGNSYAMSRELSVRSIKILNNSTLTSFDRLHIGVNNLIDHVGLNYAENDAHGWELGLANLYENRVFGNRNVYLIKTGQGGSQVLTWVEGHAYSAESQTIFPYTTFIARVQAGLHLVDSLENGRTPDVVMLWSCGINDAGALTSTSIFKDTTIHVFNALRTAIGINFPIIQTQFQDITPVYDTKIAEIASELTDVYYISTAGYETTQVFAGAGYHWGYTGMKQMAAALTTIILSIIQ